MGGVVDVPSYGEGDTRNITDNHTRMSDILEGLGSSQAVCYKDRNSDF